MGKTKNEDKEAEDRIDSLEIVPETENNIVDDSVENEEDDIPDMADPKWSEYVLSHFEEDEIVDGMVLTDGLRRVVNKILGPIMRSVPVRETAPDVNNNYHATVAWEVDIQFPDGSIRTFGDVADVSEANTDPTFAIHASATAATKAEGRALRKALQLKRILTVDEIGATPINKISTDKINNQQIGFMNMVCERMNINIMKLLKLSKQKYAKIEDVSYANAVLINKYLSECQRGKDAKGNPRVIPENIKGYDPNWRKSDAQSNI